MNGAKIMVNSIKVTQKNELLLSILNSIPDVEAVNTAELVNSIKITGHAPLEVITSRYVPKSRFWTKDYDLWYELTCKSIGVSGKIKYNDGHFSGGEFSDKINTIIGRLNANEMLNNIILRNDIIGLEIQFFNNKSLIRLSLMSGTITKMLIPPTTYFVRPRIEECVDVFQILQLILTIIGEE